MPRRLTVTIAEDAARRLSDVARAERRDPRQQAALILERALAQRARRATEETKKGDAATGHAAKVAVPPGERRMDE